MILKQVYSKNLKNIESFNDKKFFTKNLYGKFLVRSSVSENFNLHVLDNNKHFFNISSASLQKFVKSNETEDILIGNSLFAREFEYKNKLNNFITIKTFIVNNKPIKEASFVTSLYNLLKTTRKESQSSLILLNPKKGGFDCYSSGVLGFMPRSHAVFALSKLFLSLSKNKTKNASIVNLNFLLNKENFIKSKILIRLSNWWGKITLTPRFRKNKFSNSIKRKRRRIFLNRTNFVFLTKKNVYTKSKNKKLNENKKT